MNNEYWGEHIKEERRKRKHLSVTPRPTEDLDVDNFSDVEVKEKLKELEQLLKDKLYLMQSNITTT